MWGPELGFRHWLAEGLNQRFSFTCGAGYLWGSKAIFNGAFYHNWVSLTTLAPRGEFMYYNSVKSENALDAITAIFESN